MIEEKIKHKKALLSFFLVLLQTTSKALNKKMTKFQKEDFFVDFPPFHVFYY